VSLGGGEPFLRADLAEVGRAFGRHGLRHLAIPTNGLVEARQHETAERLARENPDTFVSVSVSFDGPPEVHDAIRRVPGGHARAAAAVRRFREQADRLPNLGVGILVCVTRENQDGLADHLEALVRELRPHNVGINLARGTAPDESLLDVDLDRYREVVERKRRLVAAGALPYFDFPLGRLAVARDRLTYARVERVARGEPGRHVPCTAGSLSAVVFEDGAVHPCEILGRPIGNLNDVGWDLGALWEGTAARELRAEIERTRCACTWECAQADNVLFDARSWPRLALAWARAGARGGA
jgi:MoaA/NifB/PqqE/SkfB family radical SAM enzyme